VFGLGRLPLLPGTWASLAALLPAWVVGAHWGSLPVAVAAIVLLFLGGWAAGVHAEHIGIRDPTEIVVDEVAGQWLVLAALPPTALATFLGFVAFRGFDILKPWPIGNADRRIHGGFGIMLDDVLAAVAAIVVCRALLWILD
jgi:phosphatidylglycerophosphatase A